MIETVNPEVVVREIGNNCCTIFNPDTGKICGCRKVAYFIWKALCDGVDTDELPKLLREKYDGVPDNVDEDVKSVLEEFRSFGLLAGSVPEK